jgi:glucose-6-phosphate dehydrogenase assembly protein OpcA
MEDVVSRIDETRLLPAGTDVPFREVGRTLQRAAGAQPSDRALIATVIVTGSHARLVEAAAALESASTGGAVRAVLISTGDDPAPAARIVGHAVALEGLRPDFIDNAVAALRLSSLPTLVWWRGGGAETLRALAALADRLVLDEDQPEATWAGLRELPQRTAVSDLRWARLTRWRALTAHFFDIPDVRAAAFTRLAMAAGDRHAARLLAGWLASALGWKGQVSIEIRDVPDGASIESVTLAGDDVELELGLVQGRTCVHTVARLRGRECAARTVALGDGGVPALIAEELRVRSRDLAFERAVAALGEVA